MKRKTLLSLMLLCFAFFGVARADEVMIGDATSTSTQYTLPVNMYYNYSLTQQIYTAEEIGTAGTINSIAFEYTSSSSFTMNNVQVYMMNVDNETFVSTTDMVQISSSNLVWEGTFTATEAGWVTLNLNTPFVYNGTSNLLVCCYDPTNGYPGSAYKFRTTATTDYFALAYYSDGNIPSLTDVSNFSGSKNRYQYRNNIMLNITPSGAPICTKPSDMLISDLTPTGATVAWTSDVNNYNLEYKMASESEWTTIGLEANTYTLTGLMPNTAYNVRVQAVCDTDLTSGYLNGSFSTPAGIPLVEPFNTSNIPTGWTRYSGLLDEVMAGTIAPTTITSGWNFGPYNGVFDSHARVNIYSTNTRYWLVTPNFVMENNVQLTFDMALTKYSGNLQPVNSTDQADDRFVVLITTFGADTTLTILREWNNTGSEYVYNNIACSAVGENVAIDLSSYAGQKIAIAFYGESTNTGGDNNLHIDNVSIDYIPACAKPTSVAATDLTAHEATLSWTSDADEWIVAYKADAEEDFTEVPVDENPYTISGLAPETTYTAKVRANCGGTLSEWSNTVNFTTNVACFVPTSFTTSNVTNHGATLTWVSDANEWIVAYKVTADTDFTEITVSDITTYTFTTLEPETNYTVKVRSNCGGEDGMSAWTSTRTFTTLVACPAPSDLTCTALTLTDATLDWTERGDATEWELQYWMVGADTTLVTVTEKPYTLENLIAENVYGARVRSACGSDWSSTITFEPTAKLVIGSGTATSGYLPTNTNYDFSYTQQIYTVEELGEAGVIESIDFYMTSTSDYTRSLDIYMVSTDKNAFENNSDWITVTDDDLVFSGEVDFAAASWNTITLDNAFIYNGTQNVAIIVDDNTAVWSSRYFLTFTASANQSHYFYRDNNDIVPNETGTNGSVTTSKNQIRILKSEMSSCMKPTNLTATVIGPDFATLSWTENGEALEWNVEVTNLHDSTTTNWIAQEIPFTIPGLSYLTEYRVRVSPECDETLWSAAINFTTLESCPVPMNLEVSDITFNSAKVTWTGYNDSYTVFYSWSKVTNFFNENFANNVPADWTNDTIYPWTVVDGHIQSGNAGVHNSSSTISFSAFYGQDGTIEFDAQCMGEGTSWDMCEFYIDDELMFEKGANGAQWDHYIFPINFGEHTFTFTFTKDGSQNGEGDHFAVDNIVLNNVEFMSGEPVIVEGTEYTLTGIFPHTEYEVMVNGICGDNATEYSEIVNFQTPYITKEITGYGSGQGNYYLIATPIGNIHPTEVTNMLANEYDLYSFRQVDGEEWLNYKGDMENFYLETGKGYLYANSEDVTLIFDGIPYDSYGDVMLEKIDNTIWSGWNLVGNPFFETAYIGDRDFYIMNSDGDEIIKSTSPSIEAMEGVFVIAEEDGEILTFTTEAPAKSAMLSINLSQGRNIVDCAAVRFGVGRNLPKLQLNPNSTKVYIPMDNVDYAVVLSESMGELPVNFETENDGSYTMSFISEEVEFSYLHLIDNMTGNDVDLLATPNYTFNARSTDNANRFKLMFALGTTGIEENFAYFNNGNFIINNEGKATMQVIDVTGRIISSETINGCASVNVNAAPGVYMLRLVNGDNVRVQKVVVR